MKLKSVPVAFKKSGDFWNQGRARAIPACKTGAAEVRHSIEPTSQKSATSSFYSLFFLKTQRWKLTPANQNKFSAKASSKNSILYFSFYSGGLLVRPAGLTPKKGNFSGRVFQEVQLITPHCSINFFFYNCNFQKNKWYFFQIFIVKCMVIKCIRFFSKTGSQQANAMKMKNSISSS